MKVEDVKQCSFEKWYSCFKKLTMRSKILPLPEGFVSYILKDGIVLPKSNNVQLIVPAQDSDSDSEVSWEDTEINEEPEAPQFPEFDKQIEDAIKTLGGKVFPKLNWSCPKDASWIAFNNSCCCTSVSDIYLLLKSSDFIIHDLTERFLRCEDYEDYLIQSGNKMDSFYLILREWTEIDTSFEFRNFVKDGKLIGICPRDNSVFLEYLENQKQDVIEDIVDFFQKYISQNFPSKNYVFDVYRENKADVILIDFNPYGVVTDSLLFTWDELNGKKTETDELPEFRYVSENHGVQPRPLSYYAVPRDIVDISSGEDSFKLADLLQLKIGEQNDSDDENEKI